MSGGTLAALISRSELTSFGTVKTDRKLSVKQETPPPQVRRRRSSSQTPPTTARDFHSFRKSTRLNEGLKLSMCGPSIVQLRTSKT